MLPFQIGRIIFEVAQLREVVRSCQLRASLYCEQQSSHANARKSGMGLTLFDSCRASVSDSENRGYLRSGKTYFVVAGAAHMGGANGVLALLRHRGYRFEQTTACHRNRADDEGPHKGW